MCLRKSGIVVHKGLLVFAETLAYRPGGVRWGCLDAYEIKNLSTNLHEWWKKLFMSSSLLTIWEGEQGGQLAAGVEKDIGPITDIENRSEMLSVIASSWKFKIS
jgi:hypothetical protein